MFNTRAAFACSLTVILCVFKVTGNNVIDGDVITGQSSLDFSSQVTKRDIEALLEEDLNPITNSCHSDADCHHEGKCSSHDSGTFCQCKDGFSGDFCEIVDACVQYPKMCGTFSDVQCIYSPKEDKPVCRCNDTSKGFDSLMKQCRVPCSRDTDCTNATVCIKDDYSDLKFCECEWGKGGDTCAEDIDECQAEGIDCGNDPDVECVNNHVRGEPPFCYCKSWRVGFHHESKSCKICACGGSNLGCKFDPEDRKICYCQRQYYDNHGKCEECNCGKESHDCKLVNGTKLCECWNEYSDNGGVCRDCYCGSKSKGCSFKNGKKTCSCESSYIQTPDGICRKQCQADDQCQRGGKCVDDLCQCVPGISGDECELIKGCETVRDATETCGAPYNVACDFNETTGKPYCRCKNTKSLYDSYDKRCKECDCGPKGNCSFVKGDQTCQCEDGYSVPDPGGYNYKCVECDCGPHGSCSFDYWKRKVCYCDVLFAEKEGICAECYCGSEGSCSFDQQGKKVCDCNAGFVEKDGLCVECDCGTAGNCEWDSKGEKTCNCKQGYGIKDGRCSECWCYWGYGNNANCTFFNSLQKCICPEGYEENAFRCIDINECLKPSACPVSTTCVNTEGSYECNCDLGYRPYDQREPKTFGCEEINECEEGFRGCDECETERACPHADTTDCINTPGSYKCVCKTGYVQVAEYSNSVELDGCRDDESSWRIGYIILATIFSISIVGLIIIIYLKRRRRS